MALFGSSNSLGARSVLAVVVVVAMCTAGSVLSMRNLPSSSHGHIEQAAQQQIQDTLKELKEWYRNVPKNELTKLYIRDIKVDGAGKKKSIEIWRDYGEAKLADKFDWNIVLPLLRDGGNIVDQIWISRNSNDYSGLWPLKAYSWYPTDLFQTLLNSAVQTDHPELFVSWISLEIPPKSGIDFAGPIEALKKGKVLRFVEKENSSYAKYELKNHRDTEKATFEVHLWYREEDHSDFKRFSIFIRKHED